MKNFTLALNVLLVVAVGFLFYLHFSSNKKLDRVTAAVPKTGFKIAYFEMDSIQNQFEYLKDIRNSLFSKDQDMGRELSQLENKLRDKYQDLQKAGSSLSQAELANRQQEIMDMDKNLKNRKQMMEQEMQEESSKKLLDAKKKIEDYLKEYNKDKGFAYIFSNVPDMIYYKDTIYNITNDLVKGLNEMYKKK
ncbi:MAG: OmpH family outer membrane protein [Bacteroidota bacterium]|nr:OmpH family outer membrane protein [Bacteroidota bacterium]